MSAEPGPGAVVRVSWQAFRVPFATAFQTSRGKLRVRQGFIVAMETGDGWTGIGEASPLPAFDGGTMAGVAEALRAMAPRCIGRRPGELWDTGWVANSGDAASEAVARAGLGTAIGDASARARGLPLWRWLAERSGVTVEDDPCIPVNATIDATGPSEAAREVERAVAEGFGTVKMKAGTGAEGDLARIAAARRAGGDSLELRIDANGAWNESEAADLLHRAEPFRIALCEQPLDPRRPDTIDATARLRRATCAPIALDESCRSAADIRAIVGAGAADAVVVKPMLTGLREAIEMVAIAAAASLPVIVTTTFDTGAGTAMATHLAALLAAPRPACGLATLDRLESSLVAGPPRRAVGVVRAGSEPGLGLTVDAAALARYAAGQAGTVAR